MVTYAALIGRDLILCVMEKCYEKELQSVVGGVSSVYAFDFWECVQYAVDFIKEYSAEIIRGFRRGWNKF